jgi:hypothetical protein
MNTIEKAAEAFVKSLAAKGIPPQAHSVTVYRMDPANPVIWVAKNPDHKSRDFTLPTEFQGYPVVTGEWP